MSKPLPCPFCGSPADWSESGDMYEVLCTGCGASLVNQELNEVIAAWNRRAMYDELVEAVGNLKAEVDNGCCPIPSSFWKDARKNNLDRVLDAYAKLKEATDG